ncbi:penicillin-binding transpeptidase domain-containing protein [Rickettsia endosymbiont of Ixodes pacificus]|uniref:penicillin-binding transpeptidase domain-containing protein n=1 Tax=Rickettsia endosymbiont of Ixodes pacificus TaxID=1133329 RepID=UPI00397E71D5
MVTVTACHNLFIIIYNIYISIVCTYLLWSSYNCESRYAPCSTFKIAISLMGYDYGFLIDETHPKLPFKEGYADYLEVGNNPKHLKIG